MIYKIINCRPECMQFGLSQAVMVTESITTKNATLLYVSNSAIITELWKVLYYTVASITSFRWFSSKYFPEKWIGGTKLLHSVDLPSIISMDTIETWTETGVPALSYGGWGDGSGRSRSGARGRRGWSHRRRAGAADNGGRVGDLAMEEGRPQCEGNRWSGGGF